jgi:(p)ppGpp synthase/HD superfamily hydrolase
LTAAFDDALGIAHEWHRDDVRKGTRIPYVSHLLQVAGLVMEAGGDEAQAIAALLHDAIEDADGAAEARSRERRIREAFGDRVAHIVLGCTDGDPAMKAEMTWEERKRRHLRHLREDADDDVLLVSVADKLQNARAILRDYRAHGESLWERFNGGREGTMWYYRALVDAYRACGVPALTEELEEVVATLEAEAELGTPR